MKTYSIKPSEVHKKWWLIDAKDLVLGRLASHASILLRGKHKPEYTPHIDCGDNVIIINADKIYLSGKKTDLKDGKIYYRHTGFPGGIKETTAGKIIAGKFPERVVKMAIKRMITRNVLGASHMRNLYVYSDTTHPHAGQTPEVYDFASKNQKNQKR